MLVLQSQDSIDQFATIDPDSLQITRLTRRSNPEHLLNQEIRGHFADLDGHSIYFYRGLDDHLHLLVDQVEVRLDDNPSVKVMRRFPGRAIFQVYCSGNEVYTLVYRRPKIDPPLWLDPTPHEEEDFDILLFIHNVLNDVGRRNRIYRGEFLANAE